MSRETDDAAVTGETVTPGRLRRGLLLLKDVFKLRVDKSRVRVRFVGAVFIALFGLIGGRLISIALAPDNDTGLRKVAEYFSF